MKIVGISEFDENKKGELGWEHKDPLDLFVLMTQEEYNKCVLAINGEKQESNIHLIGINKSELDFIKWLRTHNLNSPEDLERIKGFITGKNRR